jgi:glycerophosphoryl diester phosphodiesterase
MGICATLVSLAICVASAQTADKIIIAHRGACGYLPEHTLEAYAFAYAQGADYIEPDLIMTKDRRLICRHDIHLEESTNIEQVYPDRKREDSRWYAADFTLEEIRTLNAEERLENRFPRGKARFEVPTLEDCIELVQGLNETTGRDVGVYPELKEPVWHAENGLPMEKALLDILAGYGYEGPNAKVFVQCFWPQVLMTIRKELGSELPLTMLISEDERSDRLVAKGAMGFIKSFATAIGPAKECIDENPDLVKWAHEAGLFVHLYTFCSDDVPAPHADAFAEVEHYLYELGVDGAFSDHPDDAVEIVKKHAKK